VSASEPIEATPAKVAGKRPAHRPKSTAKPKSLGIPQTKRKRYLEGIERGLNPKEAAELVGLTATRFKSLAHNDEAFREARDLALEQRRSETVEKARTEMIDRQLSDDVTLKSDRGLHNLLMFIDPEYRAAHRQSGTNVSVTTEMEVTNVHIAVEAARDRLVQKLAPVLELAAARDVEAEDRVG